MHMYVYTHIYVQVHILHICSLLTNVDNYIRRQSYKLNFGNPEIRERLSLFQSSDF